MGKFSAPRGNRFSDPESYLEPNLEDDDFSFSPTPPEDVDIPTPPPKKKHTATICLCVIAVILLVVIAVGGWLMVSGGFDNGLILPNVYVADVDLSGLTQQQALTALEQSIGDDYAQTALELQLPEGVLTLSPLDTGASLDLQSALDAAYSYGRSGNWLENWEVRKNAASNSWHADMLSLLNLDLEYIRTTLNDYCNQFNSEYTPSAVTVTGTLPVLDASDAGFSLDAPGETLVITRGTPGRHIDPDRLYQQVLDAYSNHVFSLSVTSDSEVTMPEDLGEQIRQLHESTLVEAQDAIWDNETFTASWEIYGYGFDLEDALAQLENAQFGDTLEIPFQYIAPENTKASLESILFRDVLGSYETKHTNNADRNTNLTLACAAINGYIIYPGKQFDYNTVVGKRTAEAGYKAADAYSSGQTVKTIGGGICQVSSTLYYCTLIADLQIDKRSPHSYVSSYMPLGMDAAVSWGNPEFRFTNNTAYPIRVEAEVSDGYVKIKLLGTDEKDYYVEMEYEVLSNTYATTVYEEYPADNAAGYTDGKVLQTAYNGCTVQSYKLKYSKETGELISREKEALSKYKKRDKVVVKIVSTPTAAENTADATA